jgi:hypothetical protein
MDDIARQYLGRPDQNAIGRLIWARSPAPKPVDLGRADLLVRVRWHNTRSIEYEAGGASYQLDCPASVNAILDNTGNVPIQVSASFVIDRIEGRRVFELTVQMGDISKSVTVPAEGRSITLPLLLAPGQNRLELFARPSATMADGGTDFGYRLSRFKLQEAAATAAIASH